MSESYEKGVQDGIRLWGDACSRMENCESCPVGVCKGSGISCQDFAKQFPAKMVSLLKEVKNKSITYAEEYRIRFPECGMSAEELYQNGMCRRAIFEGYVACEESDCIKCWNAPYVGDVELSEEEEGGLNNI